MANLADELTLLDRVFFRIGAAETDEQLQSAVLKFLPPVLLKLSSEQEGVRKKVMELLVHVNKRIKSRPMIQLPVEALILQYQDPSASLFVTNFTVIYIKLGYPRLPMAKQVELLPTVLNSLEGKPQSHQDGILLILMPVFGHVTVPADSEKRKALFGFSEHPQICKLLADFMLDMLLLPYRPSATPQPEQQQQEQQQQAQTTTPTSVPAGMSEYSFKRVTAGSTYKSEELEQIKLGIVKFIGSQVMAENEIVCHLVVASADTRFTVADAAEMELKKITGVLDWDSMNVTIPLYTLFLGTQLLQKARQGTVKSEHIRSPVSTRIRLKILPFLCKSRGQALVFPACIQVLFDSLYGNNTNSRLKNLALQFAMLIVTRANIQHLTAVSGVLFSGLLKLIAGDDNSLKVLVYNAIGKLGNRIPHLVNKDIALLQRFFESLSQEELDTRMSIREALLNMAETFCNGLDEESEVSSGSQRRIMLHALLANQIESQEPMARFVAVRYAAIVFPPNHAPSRYLLLLASGDSKDEISNEALKSLYGRDYKIQSSQNNSSSSSNSTIEKDSNTDSQKQSSNSSEGVKQLTLPEFYDMAELLADKATARMKNSATCTTVGSHVLPFSTTVFREMLNYLRLCLAHSSHMLLKISESLQHPSDSTPLIGRYLYKTYQTQTGCEILDKYQSLAQQLLTANPNIVPLTCLLEVIGTIPDLMASKIIDKQNWMKGLLGSPKEEMREAAALLYGVMIANGFDDTRFEDAVRDLLSTVKSKSQLEAQHGCLLAAAHALERKTAVLKKCNGPLSTFVASEIYKDVVDVIVNNLSHQHVMIVMASCAAISELARSAPLPLPNGSPATWKLDLVKILLDNMNNVKFSTKVRERAIKACGFLCVGEEFPHSKEIMQGFIEMSKKSKDVEVHFTIGEAFVSCIQGLTSPHGRDSWTVLESEFHPQVTDDILNARKADLEWLLNELLNKLARDPHPNSRQATGIWLLALLKYCPKWDPVQQQLSVIQANFMDLLSENNEIVQDVASKGLGLVYECGDENRRNHLVSELLETLTTGRRTVVPVTEDTKIFEDDSLGKSPTGGNLSTYKELCSLASDLNKPDLIYKFMQLANHNTMWNSKKGAAFGFTTIATLAGEQLAQHLPKIVPRLYRYQFDPTPKIQISMTRIWHALVPESQKTIDLYHKEILEDLITNLTAREWRVRTSCCLALIDFLQGGGSRTLYDSIDSLPSLWTQMFRVMDDVHEGTRQAAGNTAKVLSKLCVQCCDVTRGKAGEEMVQKILPVLLNVGICNTVYEVRAVSLHCLSQLVGSAGSMLKPHLPVLIPALIEATGELESRGLSEMSVIFGAERQTQEVIDTLRASAAKSHYTTETVTKCLQYVDASILDELIPKVLELMNTRVLLGTRVASAHLIVLLTQHLQQELQPYTGKLLAALVNGMTDRSAAIRKNYAATIGYLVKTAKRSSIEKLFAKLKTWYFEKEDESIRSAIAYTFHSISQHNQDILREHGSVVIPVIFFAMHANKPPEDKTVELWEEVWHEVTPGTESGIRQHMAEICETLEVALKSPSWTMKAQAAKAISTIAMKVETITTENRNSLIGILVAGLSGRTWNGKENILKALATICTRNKSELRKEEFSSLVDNILDAVLKECRKDDPSYKQEALKAYGDILEALDVDRFVQVYSIVEEILSAGYEEKDSHKENSEDKGAKRELLTQLTETAYLTLGKSWPTNHITQVRYREEVLEKCVSCLANSTRSVQVAIMSALRYYLERLTLFDASSSLDSQDKEALNRILAKLYEAVQFTLGITKHTKLRKEALNILYLLAKKMKDLGCTEELCSLSVKFEQSLEEVGKDHTPEIKSRVVDIKEILKS